MHKQIHTLGAPHKVHFQFLRKLKDFKCTLWYEKYSIQWKKQNLPLNIAMK